MMQKYKKAALFITGFLLMTTAWALPNGFVYLQEVDPTIIQDMRYVTANNFIGKPITGYQKSTCILTRPAAEALSQVQKELLKKSLSLKVYDCYRPQMAVNEFIEWSKVVKDQKMRKDYYPLVNKADFFKLGYVAEKSGHTRGSTVDLTIVELQGVDKKPIELNMGTHFDYMDELSHSLSEEIKGQAHDNRLMLRNRMLAAGFKPIKEEWWHFTLKNEPYPQTYFNFPVE